MLLSTNLIYGITKTSNISFIIYYVNYEKVFEITKYLYNFFLFLAISLAFIITQ